MKINNKSFNNNPFELNKIVKSRPLEDINVLEKIESMLAEKRGYVFQIPKKGSPVICFMSGGLDSAIVTAMLMEEYHLQVYPIFFNRFLPHSRWDHESVQRLAIYYSHRYKKLFRWPQKLDIKFPPNEIDQYLLPNSGQIFLNEELNHRRGIPGLLSIYADLATLYAFYLKEQKDVAVKTIIGSTLPTNIDWFAYESLTTHRVINLEICTSLKDFDWQYTSLPIEKELGLNLRKEDLIRWGYNHNIPLEKTRTCNSGRKYHCGICDVCGVRKESFQYAGVKDFTIYRPLNEFINKVKRKIRKMFL